VYAPCMHSKGKAFTARTADSILESDGYICAYCGEPAIYVDHINPRANGGSNEQGNGVAACRRCNAQKGARLDLPVLARGFFVALSRDVSKRSDNVSAASQPDTEAGSRSREVAKEPPVTMGRGKGAPVIRRSPSLGEILRISDRGTVPEPSSESVHSKKLRYRSADREPVFPWIARRNCDICGDLYTARTHDQRFCGPTCLEIERAQVRARKSINKARLSKDSSTLTASSAQGGSHER
jgi:HNH endonuclease